MNSLPKDKIFDRMKFKTYADDKKMLSLKSKDKH